MACNCQNKKKQNTKEFKTLISEKPKKQTPNYLYVTINGSYSYTREPDSDDGWDAGEDAFSYASTQVWTQKPLYDGYEKIEAIAIDFDMANITEVYVVLEDYDSGSTFGHTSNNIAARKVFKTAREADQWMASPEGEMAKDRDYFGGHNRYFIECCKVQ